ncbi:MAG: hypothetical protein RJA59_1422, partial [Pseudomonadota bacterium]
MGGHSPGPRAIRGRLPRVSRWEPKIFLDPEGDEPIFRQLASALVDEIRRGRFRPGDHLPGYRTVAEQLGISRNTVIAAYQALQEEGWVVTQPVVGSVVAPNPPVDGPVGGGGRKTGPRPETVGFDVFGPIGGRSLPPARGLLKAGSGVPDPRLVPGLVLARAYRRAVTARGGAALAPGDPRGHPVLREALARMIASTRALSVEPSEILVTRGSQMALFLLAQAICPPGLGVAVEALGDQRIWDGFARSGARCLPVPVDGDGLDVEALDRMAAGGGLRAVLVTPRRQYP